MTIEQLGILLTLLLTTVGWMVTAYYQRKILERQLESERQKEARLLVVPVKIQRLNEMRSWVDAALELIPLKLNNLVYKHYNTKSEMPPSENLGNKFKDWVSSSGKYTALITQLEIEYEPKTRGLSTLISQLYQNMIDFMSTDLTPQENFDEIYQAIIDATSNLFAGIDELIELCATQELRHK